MQVLLLGAGLCRAEWTSVTRMEEHAGSLVNLLVNLEPEWLQPYLPLEVVTAWLILGLVVFMAWLGTRRMQRVPVSGWQTLGEWTYSLCTSLCEQFGLSGERYAPMLGTLFAYILIMNLTGLIPGFTSPTATLNMTLALALVTLASVQIYGMREKGWRYLEHFVDGPWWMWPLMVPIHLIGEIAIGQVLVLLGSIVVMHQLNILLRAPMVLGGVLLLHIPLLLLGLLVSLIQAVIFVMLTAVYLQGAVSSHS